MYISNAHHVIFNNSSMFLQKAKLSDFSYQFKYIFSCLSTYWFFSIYFKHFVGFLFKKSSVVQEKKGKRNSWNILLMLIMFYSKLNFHYFLTNHYFYSLQFFSLLEQAILIFWHFQLDQLTSVWHSNTDMSIRLEQ